MSTYKVKKQKNITEYPATSLVRASRWIKKHSNLKDYESVLDITINKKIWTVKIMVPLANIEVSESDEDLATAITKTSEDAYKVIKHYVSKYLEYGPVKEYPFDEHMVFIVDKKTKEVVITRSYDYFNKTVESNSVLTGEAVIEIEAIIDKIIAQKGSFKGCSIHVISAEDYNLGSERDEFFKNVNKFITELNPNKTALGPRVRYKDTAIIITHPFDNKEAIQPKEVLE